MSLSITEAKKGKEADHGNHWWNLKLDDGREAYGQFKKDLTVGEQVVEMYEKDGRVRVKRPDKEQGQASSNGSSGEQKYEQDSRALRGKNASSALHAANAFHGAGPGHPSTIPGPELLEIASHFYDFIESKAQVGASTGASETTRQEAGSHPQTAVRSQDDAAQPAPEVPVGAPPTPVDILKARLDYGIDPDTFSMLLAAVGADSVQATTEEQRAELLVQLGQLKAA